MKSSAHTLGDGHERLIYLDFLRILACLCIITVHFNATVSGYANGIFVYNNSVIPNHYFGNLSLGDIGVSFFFMISGASLQYVYPEGCRPLKKYYFKRAMAIYPAFWIAFAAFTTFDFIWSGGLLPDIPLQKLLWSVTGMDGYALTMGWDQAGFYQIGEWYLGCILLIYIIYPLVSKGVNKYPVATLIGMACIYALLIHRIQYIWFFLRLPEVMLGMIFIKYVKSAKSIRLWGITAVAFACRVIFDHYLHPITQTTITCFVIFLLVALICELFDGIWRAEFVRKLAHISALTYPAFLIHHKLIALMTAHMDLAHFTRGNSVALYFLYLTLVFALSVLLYKVTKYLTKRITARQPSVAAKK